MISGLSSSFRGRHAAAPQRAAQCVPADSGRADPPRSASAPPRPAPGASPDTRRGHEDTEELGPPGNVENYTITKCHGDTMAMGQIP